MTPLRKTLAAKHHAAWRIKSLNAVARNETIHFHELIHIIQWRLLGAKNFLRVADGLERFGYMMSPLESVAYDAEAAFSAADTFDAELLVSDALAKLRG